MRKTHKKKEKISRNTIPENFSLGLAIFDGVPVLLFGLSVLLIGAALHSILFLIGGVISFWAGTAKVIWKIIVVKRKQNIWWLFIQLRIFMPIGFVLMIVGALLCRGGHYASDFFGFAITWPVYPFLFMGAAGFMLMCVSGALLDSSDVKANWIEQSINTFTQLAVFFAALLLALSVGFLRADSAAIDALKSDDNVKVELTDIGLVFTPAYNGNDKGVIIYPGGKVEFAAYAPLARKLSEQGISCVLVEMPLNYAFLNYDAADDVMKALPEIQSWTLVGHSLGGAFGSIYASKNEDKLSGVVLLGAYSTKPLKNLPVLVIYGSEDGVMRRNNFEKCRENLPDDYIELVISGGNHAMFGSYGFQPGDNEALITAEEQLNITADAILNFLG